MPNRDAPIEFGAVLTSRRDRFPWSRYALLFGLPAAEPRRASSSRLPRRRGRRCVHRRYARRRHPHGPRKESFTPESPEVKKAVASAVAYLEKLPEPDDRLRAKALVGRVMVYQGKSDHPHVKRAVRRYRSMLKQPNAEEPSFIYSLGLSLVFLLELDPEAYSAEIGGVVRLLVERQKSHGGWGYLHQPTSDTSMTQYGIYGLWTAEQHGYERPDDVWRRALKWLTVVQDVGGASPCGQVPDVPERIASGSAAA